MSTDDDGEGAKVVKGAPLWMTTFADLMSLLMTLFILLLTFAEMDVKKYQQLAGNMKEAFGIQHIKRMAGIIEKDGNVTRKTASSKVPKVVQELAPMDEVGEPEEETDKQEEAPPDPKNKQNEQIAENVKAAISDEISQALANVRMTDEGVVVQFPNKIAFPSGNDMLTPEFLSALEKMKTVLETATGEIIVVGHTDNLPIKTDRFRSNWDLSGSRASSVVHFLLENTTIEPGRLGAVGYADSRPLESNDTPEGRASNRRVEIIIRPKAIEINDPAPSQEP